MSAMATVTPLGHPTRIVLVEPRAMLRHALSAVLRSGRDAAVEVVEALSTSGVLDTCSAYDVVLVSTDARIGGTPATVEEVVAAGGHVLLHGQCIDVAAVRTRLERGASGFVCYDEEPARWVEAVRLVRAGRQAIAPCIRARITESAATRPALSQREQEVFTAYATGSALKQVARQLGLAEHTAKAYLDRARTKYEAAGRPARNRVMIYRRAVEDGYLPPPLAEG